MRAFHLRTTARQHGYSEAHPLVPSHFSTAILVIERNAS